MGIFKNYTIYLYSGDICTASFSSEATTRVGALNDLLSRIYNPHYDDYKEWLKKLSEATKLEIMES